MFGDKRDFLVAIGLGLFGGGLIGLVLGVMDLTFK